MGVELISINSSVVILVLSFYLRTSGVVQGEGPRAHPKAFSLI